MVGSRAGRHGVTTGLLKVQRQPDEALRDFSVLEKLALTVEITLVYFRVRGLLRRGDLRSTLASLRGATLVESARYDDSGLVYAGRLGGIVDGHLRFLPGDTRCLARSLVLLRLLARRGIPGGALIIGVRTEPAFGAHAWVELDGRSLSQPIEATGSRLVEL